MKPLQNNTILVRVVILCISITCCLSVFAQSTVTKIHVEPRAPKGDLSLSKLVGKIEYIPLETKDKCLIGELRNFDISQNYILTYCFTSSHVYLFRRDGRFVAQIGRVGEGPEEYLPRTVGGCFIDEANSQVILDIGRSQLLVYDLRGKFVRRERAEKEFTRWNLRFINNIFYNATANFNGNKPFAYEIRDRNMKLLSENIPTVSFTFDGLSNFVGTPKSYLYEDKLYVKEVSLNDTIYRIEKDYRFTPQYVVDAGKYEITTKVRASVAAVGDFQKIMPSYIQFASFHETKDFLFFSYYYDTKDNYAYYDKNDKKVYNSQSGSGIPNDYDGGIAFWPKRQDNKIWYAFYNASQFEDELETQKKLTPKGSQEAISRFNGLMKKLDPEDNPVFVIVQLK